MDNANDGGMAKAPEMGQGDFAPNSQQRETGVSLGTEQSIRGGLNMGAGRDAEGRFGSGAERNINRVNLEPIAKPDEIAPDLGNATLAMPDLMATPPEVEGMEQTPDVAEIMRQEKNRERAGEGTAMDILEFARNEEMKAEQDSGFAPEKVGLGEFIGGTKAEQGEFIGRTEAEQGKMQGAVKEADLTTLADGGSTEGRKIVSLDGDVMDKESEKMVIKAYNELPLKNLHSWRHEQMRKALKANYNRDFGEERAA